MPTNNATQFVAQSGRLLYGVSSFCCVFFVVLTVQSKGTLVFILYTCSSMFEDKGALTNGLLR